MTYGNLEELKFNYNTTDLQVVITSSEEGEELNLTHDITCNYSKAFGYCSLYPNTFVTIPKHSDEVISLK